MSQKKFVIFDSYKDLMFVPKSTNTPEPFKINPQKLRMVRTPFFFKRFTHLIEYVPDEIGIVYYQTSTSKFSFYTLISPDIPFVYFFAINMDEGFEDRCTYKDFINNKVLPFELIGADQINAYLTSHDFTDEEAQEYFQGEDNGPEMTEFEKEENEDSNGVYDDVQIDFSTVTLNINDSTWDNAKAKLLTIAYAMPKKKSYVSFFQGTLNNAIKKVDDMVKAKLSKRSDKLAIWNSTLQQIKGGVNQVLTNVKSLLSPATQNDDQWTTEVKNSFDPLYTEEVQAIMNEELQSFMKMVTSDLPLFAGIFYKASFNESINYMGKDANEIVEAGISIFESNEYNEEQFVNQMTLLNYNLMLNVFYKVNHLFQTTPFGAEINNIDSDLQRAILDPINEFLSDHVEDSRDSFFEYFDLWGTYFNKLVLSHPYFTMFMKHFNAVVEPELRAFYKGNKNQIKKYKMDAGETFDGKGFKAFTFQHYRMNLKIEDPSMDMQTSRLVNSNKFLELNRRILI